MASLLFLSVAFVLLYDLLDKMKGEKTYTQKRKLITTLSLGAAVVNRSWLRSVGPRVARLHGSIEKSERRGEALSLIVCYCNQLAVNHFVSRTKTFHFAVRCDLVRNFLADQNNVSDQDANPELLPFIGKLPTTWAICARLTDCSHNFSSARAYCSNSARLLCSYISVTWAAVPGL